MRKDVFERRAAEMRARLQAQREGVTSGRPYHQAQREPSPATEGVHAVGLPTVGPHQLVERTWKPAYTKAVLTALPGAHALITKTAHSVGKSQVGFDGLLSLGGERGLDINVSLPCLSRALQLYEMLIRSVAGLGGDVILASEGTMVRLDGETERIRLREGTIRHRKPANDSSLDKYTYEATGLLYFVLLERGGGKCKTLVREKTDVADFLDKMRKTFARRPLVRAEREARQREREAEQQRRAEQERLEAEAQRQWREQQQRFDAFYQDVSRWRKAAHIRAYLAAFTQEYERRHDAVVPGSRTDGWLHWLHGYAERLDPLTSEDEPHEQPEGFSQRQQRRAEKAPRLKVEGFKPQHARRLPDIGPNPSLQEKLPRRYVALAVEAFRRGELSEGQLSRFLRTDRVAARLQVEEAQRQIYSEQDEFAGLLDLDFSKPLESR